MPALHRRVVDVDAGGRGAGGRVDAANADIRVLVVVVRRRANTGAREGYSRGESGQIVDIFKTLCIELRLREAADANGHVLQTLRTAGRRDDDLLKAVAGGRLVCGALGDVRCRSNQPN